MRRRARHSMRPSKPGRNSRRAKAPRSTPNAIPPIVPGGTSREDALPIDASVPDPAREPNAERAKYLREALDYMGIAPGRKLTDIAIDRVFIGSCTHARLPDLRPAGGGVGGGPG